ncbi:MAG: glycosyltransferase family 4 protein [Bryobacteraceae bacterium]|jgi:glycosyltransferase involved in cell wall biosynthesis
MKRPGGNSASEPAALLLSLEAPFPAAGGGALRTASIIEYLARRYAVDLIVFHERGAPDPRPSVPPDLVRDVYLIELPHHSRRLMPRAARNALRLLLGVPPLAHRFSGYGGAIAACLGSRRYRVAFIEHSYCAPYLEQIAARAEECVLDLHNIESALFERYAATEPWPLSLAFRRFARANRRLERQWLPRFSRVLVASEDDRGRALGLAPQASVAVYPNAIPEAPRPAVPEENVIVFSGNLEYQPNMSAVRFFAKRIWPALEARHPGLVWRIVGKNPHGVAKYVAGRPRIELIGPVDDAIGALGAARVVVVPLLAGGGTRLKILEAWAAGRAVVSTTVGAEGLPARDGEHLLIADTAETFAAAVSRLLDSPAERARLGAAGRALCEERLTWPRAWEALANLGI